MIGQLLWIDALLLLVYMTCWWAVGKRRNRLNVVDVAWGGGFILVAWSVFAQVHDVRNMMIAALVTLWGLRLMSHLWLRVIGSGKEDPRYEDIKRKWRGSVWLRAYFSIFLLQGALILLISLPVTVAANPYYPDLTWLLYAGTAVWFVGFTIERIADAQLREFISKPSNTGKVMDQGLWRYSRHPNYFGELTQWWGIGVIALQSTYGWIGLAGPLTLTILILFVSGVPPIEDKKKHESAYATYMRRTSMIIPLPPKKH